MELHVSDGGGVDIMSEAELSLCRRCATLEISLEQMEAAMSEGKPADPEVYARIASHLRRLLETLGIKRRPREIESNPLIDYFNHPSPPRAAEADDEDEAPRSKRPSATPLEAHSHEQAPASAPENHDAPLP